MRQLELNVRVEIYMYDIFIGARAYIRISVRLFVTFRRQHVAVQMCNCLLSVHGINLFLFCERTIVRFLYDCNGRRSSENVVLGNNGSCPHVFPLPCHSVS